MKLKSSAFDDGGVIPERFSQYGENRTPPIDFEDVPAGARSLALIVDDPDAPRGTFTHWVVFNIDSNTSGFRENRPTKDVRFGLNDYGDASYAGPKPPSGEHRYFFRAYALDERLGVPHGAARADVEAAMTGHIIEKTELMGRYAKPLE